MAEIPGKKNVTPKATPEQLSSNLSRVLQQAAQAKADADASAATQKGDKGDAAAGHGVDPVAPTAEETTRAEVVEQLKGAGLFDRKIIGSDPADLTDSDINDLVQELGRRTFVSEVTGTPVQDVTDTWTLSARSCFSKAAE